MLQKQVPGILFTIQKESEAILNNLTMGANDRLAHVQEYIANITK
jgi:hypothetical protein